MYGQLTGQRKYIYIYIYTKLVKVSLPDTLFFFLVSQKGEVCFLCFWLAQQMALKVYQKGEAKVDLGGRLGVGLDYG